MQSYLQHSLKTGKLRMVSHIKKMSRAAWKSDSNVVCECFWERTDSGLAAGWAERPGSERMLGDTGVKGRAQQFHYSVFCFQERDLFWLVFKQHSKAIIIYMKCEMWQYVMNKKQMTNDLFLFFLFPNDISCWVKWWRQYYWSDCKTDYKGEWY